MPIIRYFKPPNILPKEDLYFAIPISLFDPTGTLGKCSHYFYDNFEFIIKAGQYYTLDTLYNT